MIENEASRQYLATLKATPARYSVMYALDGEVIHWTDDREEAFAYALIVSRESEQNMTVSDWTTADNTVVVPR